MEASLNGARVLLAEPGQGDDLVFPLLEGTGAVVVRVFSPEDLLHRLHREKVDLVLIDSRFDHPDLLQLVRDARSRSKSVSLGIVIATAGDELSLMEGVLKAGATELLVRPFCAVEAVRRLDSAVRLRRAIGHAAQLEADRLREHTIASDLVARLSHLEPRPAEGWTVDVRHEAAANPAGDFHDAFLLGDGRFAVCVGDVLGTGADALVRVAAVRAAIRMAAVGAESAAGVIARVHHAIRGMWPEGELIKLHVGIVDPASGIILHCGGGSDGVWAVSAKGELRAVLDRESGGPPVGAVDEAAWSDARALVEPGGCVVIATDGCWNARDGRGGLLDADRFRRILETAAAFRGSQLLDSALDAIMIATGGSLPSDDRTLLVVGRD